jgi:hypothetical protein
MVALVAAASGHRAFRRGSRPPVRSREITMLVFKYRYVRFGTRFSATRDTLRTSTGPDQPPGELFRNELVVDVGGTCWGTEGETRSILDHHFKRRDDRQFPSAATAVLHNAERIGQLREQLEMPSGDAHTSAPPGAGVCWLVAHRAPDFDAFAAMYLARALLSGELPAEGWSELGLDPAGWNKPSPEHLGIDWFQPDTARFGADRRWAVLLAGYAACVDFCRPLACPTNRTPHSVLYAALHRGRDYCRESDELADPGTPPAELAEASASHRSSPRLAGAREFFDEMKRRLVDAHHPLNPWFDAVFEGSSLFAPELNLLDRELETYRRDIRRARRTIVFIQKAPEGFDSWYSKVAELPLMDKAGHVESTHLYPPNGNPAEQAYQPADGIYIRQPQCLLFKEWARNDTENSTFGRGFLFTAIASMSTDRARTEYYFSLDPERAVPANLHLYNVWAQLQAAEVRALPGKRAGAAGTMSLTCREGYEGRAAGQDQALFHDPWFDGNNYNCTIIPSPAAGSRLAEGEAGDLSDDRPAAIVQRELEYSIFAPTARIEEFAIQPGQNDKPVVDRAMFDEELKPVAPGYWRFGAVQLKPDVDLAAGPMAEQIGQVLWHALEPDAGPSLPADFVHRHLMRGLDWVGVWSRRGIMVAFKEPAAGRVRDFWRLMAELSALAREIDIYTRPLTDSSAAFLETVLTSGEKLLRGVADFQRQLSLLDHRLIERFFEALRMDAVLASVHEVHRAMAERAQRKFANELERQQVEISQGIHEGLESSAEIQGRLEWLEIVIVAAYVVEFIHVLHETFTAEEKSTGPFWSSTPFVVLVLSLLAAILAFRLLRPDKHGSGHKKSSAAGVGPIRKAARSGAGWLTAGLLVLPVCFFLWEQLHRKPQEAEPVKPPAAGAPAGDSEKLPAVSAPAGDSEKLPPKH